MRISPSSCLWPHDLHRTVAAESIQFLVSVLDIIKDKMRELLPVSHQHQFLVFCSTYKVLSSELHTSIYASCAEHLITVSAVVMRCLRALKTSLLTVF